MPIGKYFPNGKKRFYKVGVVIAILVSENFGILSEDG